MKTYLPLTKNFLETNPFDFSEKSKQNFIESLKENILHHYQNNSKIKAIFDYQHYDLNTLKSEEDIAKLPFLMVNLFKQRSFITGPENELALVLTSSGTSGQKSVMRLNQESLDNVKQLAFNVYNKLGACDNKKYNYLCFTYDPKIANDLGTAFTDELLTSFTQKNEVYYAIKWNTDKNDWHLDEGAVCKKLIEFSKSNYPTRILGFPAFLYKIIKEHKLNINLGLDSWLLTGGGWKNHADEEIAKDLFRCFIQDHLGIPKENQRDLFGMVEHGIPYVDCPQGKLRIPNYARVLIRDPKTLNVQPNGQAGLIQFLCSYNSSYPNFNILTTDMGMIKSHADSNIYGDELIILGRAGVTKHKGCALKANELLK